MKLKNTLLVLAGATTLGASAQTMQPASSDAAAHRVAFSRQPGSNYFLTLGGGVGAMFLEGNNNIALQKRLTWTSALAIGKWHNPYYGTRLKLVGGETFTYHNDTRARNENYYVGGHFDFLFDVVNYFSTYRQDRLFHVIPYLGIGMEHKFNHTDKSLHNTVGFTANGGVQLNFHVAPRVDLFVEGEAAYNNLNIHYNYSPNYSNAFRVSAIAGIGVRLGKQGFREVEPLDQSYIDGLQSQISALRAENAELSKRPANCPDVDASALAAPAVSDRFVADKSILFGQGKSEVTKDQLITVFDAAEFVKKGEGELIVTGYAAKNESRFKSLAQKRAQAVARLLTDKYGVSSDKITVEWKDASEAPYSNAGAGWNRVVVIRSK